MIFGDVDEVVLLLEGNVVVNASGGRHGTGSNQDLMYVVQQMVNSIHGGHDSGWSSSSLCSM
jgi:hypothetical protein